MTQVKLLGIVLYSVYVPLCLRLFIILDLIPTFFAYFSCKIEIFCRISPYFLSMSDFFRTFAAAKELRTTSLHGSPTLGCLR